MSRISACYIFLPSISASIALVLTRSTPMPPTLYYCHQIAPEDSPAWPPQEFAESIGRFRIQGSRVWQSKGESSMTAPDYSSSAGTAQNRICVE